MSKGILKGVAVVAGAVAIVATAGAALLPAGAAIGGLGVSTIATVASLTATAANMASTALQKPPPARGAVSQVLIAPDAPMPYVMGEGYVGGVLRFDRGYGATLKKVPNPYRAQVYVYSGGGPVDSISPRVDYNPVSGYYSGFLTTSTQLGVTPEGSALAFSFGTPLGWGPAAKLSGYAAIGFGAKFDKDGKKFSGGLPLQGAYGRWVKVYDPRKDSTFPGGLGSHRLGNEATYEWSENPALHAGTYAFGRYQNGKRVFGMGLPADGINWQQIAAWASVCDANGWSIFGRIFEPGDRKANLIDICAAGGGEPVPGAIMGFRYSAPTVALDTLTEDDLTDDASSLTAMQGFRDRINTVVPKYVSPDHNWEMVDAEPVVNATFLAEDGEEKRDTWPFNLVKSKDQAAQLATYRMFDSREIAPIVVTCKPRMRHFRPGECLQVNLAERFDFVGKAIIRRREIDPATMKVTLELMSETTAKHAYCLGQTGIAPPTPALGQSAEERDAVAAAVADGLGARTLLSRTVNFPLSSDDTSITVQAFTGVTNTATTIDFPAGSINGLANGTDYVVLWSISGEVYLAAPYPATAELASSDYVVIGRQLTSNGGVYDDPEPPPPGNCVADDTPVLLADGSEVPASQLEVGTLLKTTHEHTMAWGAYPVAAISFHDEAVFACPAEATGGRATIRATAKHRFLIEGRWVTADTIGTPDGTARVAKITVAEAHTYISAGAVSHNAKAENVQFQ